MRTLEKQAFPYSVAGPRVAVMDQHADLKDIDNFPRRSKIFVRCSRLSYILSKVERGRLQDFVGKKHLLVMIGNHLDRPVRLDTSRTTLIHW